MNEPTADWIGGNILELLCNARSEASSTAHTPVVAERLWIGWTKGAAAAEEVGVEVSVDSDASVVRLDAGPSPGAV